MIATDTYHLILSQESLTTIANHVSKAIKRKLGPNEVDALIKFIARTPESRYYQKDYAGTQKAIAQDFLTRNAKMLRVVQEQDLDDNLSGVSADTDIGGISDYNRKEISQLTDDENSFKFTAHVNRRGDAVIDRERVEGKRSSPDNLLPTSAVKTQYLVNKELFKMARMIQKLLAPESTEDMFSKFQTMNTNYYSINLVHQIVQFDSRYRLPNYTNNNSDFRWYVHTAGQAGQLGAVRILDTIQQVIQMRIFPFWVPVNTTTLNPYAKIRLLIREFINQCITAYEFNDPTQSLPEAKDYHFEFDVEKQVGDRLYLVPIQNEFTFRKPMARIESITTNFRTPFQEDIFDPDSGVYTMTFGNPTLLTLTNFTDNFLNTGDLIYIYNSDSGIPTLDAELDSPYGYVITKLSATQFTIAVDSSAAVGSQTGVNVYYGSKRVTFQIEFIALEQ
jgi:hypothetical protein